jgi:hypothetical protein
VTFSDSDWTRDLPATAPAPRSQQRLLTIVVAVGLACVALASALYGVERWLGTRERELAPPAAAVPAPAASLPVLLLPQVPTAEPAAAAAAAVASAPAPAPASAVAVADAPARTEADVRREQMAALEAEMRERARETADRAAAEAARRKERAWERWYQRPQFCNHNPTGAQMVQCANHHIRARKEFEERYAAGRL